MNELVRLRFGFECNCCFCDVSVETTEHIFFKCVYTWEDVHFWLFSKVSYLVDFTKKDSIFGILKKENKYNFKYCNYDLSFLAGLSAFLPLLAVTIDYV